MTEAITSTEDNPLETHIQNTLCEPTIAHKLFLELKKQGLFEYEKHLGSGAFGSVVQINTPAKKIALKLTKFNPQNTLFSSQCVGEPLSLTFPRYKHLGRSLALLTYDGKNVHILKSYNPELHSKHIFLGNISRAIDGYSLHDLLKKRKCNQEELAAFSKQIAEAIIALHFMNYVHKDIHVENILIKKELPHRIRLIDFQLTREATTKDLKKDWKKYSYLLMEMAPPSQINDPNFFDLIFSPKRGLLQGHKPYTDTEILSHPFFIPRT
jgi:serine/threonine protein kinase